MAREEERLWSRHEVEIEYLEPLVRDEGGFW